MAGSCPKTGGNRSRFAMPFACAYAFGTLLCQRLTDDFNHFAVLLHCADGDAAKFKIAADNRNLADSAAGRAVFSP